MPTSTPPSDLALSPSLFHQRQMDEITQALTFDGGDVSAWQNRLRPKVAELLGALDWPAPDQRVPLNPRTIWQGEHELGTIEKVAFTAEPGSDVLAYVCLPRNAKPPYKWVICLQGHTTGAHHSIGRELEDNDKPMAVEGDRDFGLTAMRHGLAALCIEQRSFGERGEKLQSHRSQQPCHDAAMHGIMIGRPLPGQRTFDVERGLDYLEQRGDADMNHVAITGNSGGGTITIFAAALLDRLAYAMPSCGFCSYRESIMSIYHCADNYVPSLLRYAESYDVLGLFAPKPSIIVAGRHDEIFPIAGVQRAFDKLKAIYAAAGQPDNCELLIGDEGHRYYADLAWPALVNYMNR